MYVKTIFCKITGIQATYSDSYWGGNLDSFSSHPFIPKLHREIAIKKYHLPAEYIAGGILLLLQDHNMLAHTDKYPSLKMAELNQAMQKIGSHKLYYLYNELQIFFANNTSRTLPTLNMMDLVGSPAVIITAIKALIGEGELDGIPVNDSILELKKYITQKRIAKRDRITLKGRRKKMNLKVMIERVKRLSRKAKKENKEQVSDIEIHHNLTVKFANSLLDMYLDLKPEIRDNLASFYKAIRNKNPELLDSYDAQSFTRIIELLQNNELVPVELETDKLDLDLFADL